MDWYFNHIYEGHIREAKSAGRETQIFAMCYEFEEFNARPSQFNYDARICCKHHSDLNTCYASIDFCPRGGQLKFHFNPHSRIERHSHSTASDWTDSDEDSEPETKQKVKAKRQAPAKLTSKQIHTEKNNNTITFRIFSI